MTLTEIKLKSARKVDPDLEQNNEKLCSTVEDILEKLGGFSWFQLIATIILISPELPSGMVAISPIFTGYTKNLYYCTDPYNNITKFNLTSKDICNVDLSYSCSLQNRTHVLNFQEFESIVTEWDLVCDKAWIVDMLTSLQMFGNMAGALISSKLADKFGRRQIFIFLCFIMGSFGLASGLATNVYAFAFTRLLSGFAVGGSFVVFLNYLMEFLTPPYRTICGCVSLWAVGEMVLALIAYYFQNWRDLCCITSLPAIFILTSYYWLPESPRWLLCQNRPQDALKVFNKIAYWNGRKEITLREVQNVEAHLGVGVKIKEGHGTENSLKNFKILNAPEHRKQILILIFNWITVSVIYYSLSFNTKNLGGNLYLNVFYLGLSDLPGYFTGLLFNNTFGRRKTMTGFLSCSSVLLSSIVILKLRDELSDEILIILSLCARYFISAAWGILSCFTAESFPTVARASCLGVCSFFGNVGGIFSAQIVFLETVWKGGSYIIYSILSIISLISCFWLKETSGKPLLDKIRTKEENHHILT